MGDLVPVAKVSDFRYRRGRTVDFEGKKVAVHRADGGWVAVSDACPHMGASLADGKIVDGKIECAWHGWKFDLRTGRNAFKEWACVTVYAVHVRGDQVFLERPDPAPQPGGGPAAFTHETEGRDDGGT